MGVRGGHGGMGPTILAQGGAGGLNRWPGSRIEPAAYRPRCRTIDYQAAALLVLRIIYIMLNDAVEHSQPID